MRIRFSIRVIVMVMLLSIGSISISFGDDEGYEINRIYGTKSADTITVTMINPAVREPMIYYLKQGATYGELLNAADWLRTSDGIVKLIRLVDGKKITMELTLKQQDLKLRHGDAVYSQTNSLPVVAETPEVFLKRVQPRLREEAVIKKIDKELNNLTIAEFKIQNAGLAETCDYINGIIRTHNKQPSRIQIPLLNIDPILLKPPPADKSGVGDYDPTNNARLTVFVRNSSLMDLIRDVCELRNIKIVGIAPDAIWLGSFVGGSFFLTRSYQVPKTIFSTWIQAIASVSSKGMGAEPGFIRFSEESHELTIGDDPHNFDYFEFWYAQQLLKQGYTKEN
jgi:hypothetical protein